MDPLEEVLHRPYYLNKLNNYISKNELKLIHDQLFAYNSVLKSVFADEGKTFFLDAPDGTGNTSVTNLILSKISSQGKIAITVASSDITATLLIGERTAHSTFKLPLTVSLK